MTSLRRRLCLSLIIAIAATVGYALNSSYLPSLSHVWMGRALTLPIAMALGPWLGALAGFLGALPAATSEPGLLLLFTLEGALLGAALRWYDSPLVGHILGAVLISLSVVVFPGIHDLPVATWSNAPLAVQRLLVLLLAPVLGDFVSTAASALSLRLGFVATTGSRRPLRAILLHAFVAVATLPILAVSTISGELFAARQQNEMNARLRDTALSLADRVNAYVDGHLSAVASLAVSLGENPTADETQRLLQRTSTVYPDFRALALADHSGRVTQMHPMSRMRPGLSVQDQSFFVDALATKRVVISDVSTSPITGDPIVFVGAPVLSPDGQATGVAHASLQLDAFDYFVESYITLPNSAVVILDRANRVIFSNRGLGYRGAQDLTNAPIVRHADASPLDSVYSYESPESSDSQRAARGIVPTTGWTVYVAQPKVLLASEVPSYFVMTVGLVLTALLGSAVGARYFASSLTAPLESLASIVERLAPDKADANVTPATAPAEIATLAEGVNRMQIRLRLSYAHLERALAEREDANKGLEQLASQLEAKVADRTVELTSTKNFLEHVLTALPGALFVSDAEGRIRLCNEAAAAAVGRATTELTGQPLSSVLEGSENASPGAPFTVRRAERTLVTTTEERVPVLVSSASFSGPDQAVNGTIYIAIDIRDRKHLEMELHQAQKLESVGRLAAGVAHEINTPTQFVSDSIQFLKEGLTDLFVLVAKYRALRQAVAAGLPAQDVATDLAQAEIDTDLDYLVENVPGAIDRSIEGLGRVTEIVRSMKEFAHPDQKEMSSIDVNRGIQSTLAVARTEYKYVADIETELGDLPPVRCYGGDLNQVILNIVVNAAHAIGDVVAGSDRKGRITIQTCRDEAVAVIRISDTGGGIPEAIRDRIFDPFFTTKAVGKGTGQGLAIARKIVVEGHGGQFSFETEVGLGTTFTIRIPIDGPKVSTEVAA